MQAGYPPSLEGLDGLRKTTQWIQDRAGRVEVFVRQWCRGGSLARDLSGDAPVGVTAADWLAIKATGCKEAVRVVAASEAEEVDTLRHVHQVHAPAPLWHLLLFIQWPHWHYTQAVMVHATDGKAVEREFEAVARHMSAHLRNLQAAMAAGRQLAGVCGRIREVAAQVFSMR
jgi:hypothetical protein